MKKSEVSRGDNLSSQNIKAMKAAFFLAKLTSDPVCWGADTHKQYVHPRQKLFW